MVHTAGAGLLFATSFANLHVIVPGFESEIFENTPVVFVANRFEPSYKLYVAPAWEAVQRNVYTLSSLWYVKPVQTGCWVIGGCKGWQVVLHPEGPHHLFKGSFGSHTSQYDGSKTPSPHQDTL